MKMSLLLVLVILSSCSQLTKKNKIKTEPVKISDSEIQQSNDYQKTVLDRAYAISKNKKTNDIVFTKDEKLARELITKFDVEQGLIKAKAQMLNNIINNCNSDTIKDFDKKYKIIGKCTLMFSELYYFQSLALALKNYSWPTDLKLEGKKVAVDYVRYFSEGNFTLLNRLVALSVLDELSMNQIVNKDLHNEIKDLMQESRVYVEGMKMKLNNDPGLSCKSMEIIRDELNYSELVGKKMTGFLTRI